MDSKIIGISLPSGNQLQLLNVCFADELLLMLEFTQQFMEGTIICLDTFAKAAGAVVSEEKIVVFQVGKVTPSPS